MFYATKIGQVEYINADYEIRPPTREETERFKRDLTRAAQTDPKVARYLDVHRGLIAELPEPQVEEPMGEQLPGPSPQNEQ
jgi:hypothetical protein